jgi:hypothetical protein
MHIAYGHKHDLKMDEVPAAGYEPILSRTTTETETSVTTNTVTTTTINTSVPTDSIDEQDEETPLISHRRYAVDSGKEVLSFFCPEIISLF